MARAVTLRVNRRVTYWIGTPPRPVAARITGTTDATHPNIKILSSGATVANVTRQAFTKPLVTSRWSPR